MESIARLRRRRRRFASDLEAWLRSPVELRPPDVAVVRLRRLCTLLAELITVNHDLREREDRIDAQMVVGDTGRPDDAAADRPA